MSSPDIRLSVMYVILRSPSPPTAHGGPAVCLFCMSLVECNREGTIGLLFAAVTLSGSMYTGFQVNHIDIAPNFAGTLYGITNAAATIPGWVAPMTVGKLTNNQVSILCPCWKVQFMA